MKPIVFLILAGALGCGCGFGQTSSSPPAGEAVTAGWHLKGEGMVCCPCAVPCPCRTNGEPSYGHCEATLYLAIRQGHFERVNLDGLKMVQTGGSCAESYQKLSALYFDRSVTPEEQQAFIKLMGTFKTAYGPRVLTIPYSRAVSIQAEITDGHLYHVAIPGILEMLVDRNWGQARPPFSFVAADDFFSNALQYIENLKYTMDDPAAALKFNYSRRQANYRLVDLDAKDYETNSMLIQFQKAAGWFTPDQLRLIESQGLHLPNLAEMRNRVVAFRGGGQGQ